MSSFQLRFYFICMLSAMLLYACRRPEKKVISPVISSDTARIAPKDLPATVTAVDTTGFSDCPVGKPESVVNKQVFPGSKFRMSADGTVGTETLDLDSSDHVEIRISGCEYYTLTVVLETSRFAADTTNLPYWFDKTENIMRKVNTGLNTPLELNIALKNLATRLQKDKSTTSGRLSLGEEIDFGGPDPRAYLSINRISKIAPKKYQVELSFSYGPV